MILHVDMDAYYASVETRDRPELQGQPVIVGGTPEGRGVVAAANYVARKYGIHSAMPAARAKRLCPLAVFLPPRMEHYSDLSRQIQDIFCRFTPLVESLSLDEAFLDVTGSQSLFGTSIEIGRQIKQEISDRLQLVASVGVAPNKFLAKLASDLQKPDGLTVVDPDRIQQLLDPLPVEKIWGVGPRTRDALHHIGLREIRHLRRAGLELLVRHLGETSGHHLWQLAHGEDHRSISTERGSRSISRESTFEIDIQRGPASDRFLREAAEEVARSLRDENLRARTVRLKVRTGSFRTLSRSLTLEAPAQEPGPLFETARSLLAEVKLEGEGIRLLGLGTGNLIPQSSPLQPGLFEDRAAVQRQQVVSQLLDRSRQIEGGAELERGKLLSKPPEDSTIRDSKTHASKPAVPPLDDPTGG